MSGRLCIVFVLNLNEDFFDSMCTVQPFGWVNYIVRLLKKIGCISNYGRIYATCTDQVWTGCGEYEYCTFGGCGQRGTGLDA